MTQYVEEILRILEENEENEEDENISYPKVKLRERLRMDLTPTIVESTTNNSHIYEK